MLSQPLGNDLFSNSRLKAPHIWVFQLLLYNLIQSIEASIVLADALLEFKVYAT